MSDLTPSLPAPPAEYLPAEVYVVRPPSPRYWLHILLFAATIFTTLVVGAKMESDFLHNAPPFVHGDETLPLFPVGWALHEPARLLLGIPFSATLLLILMAHEMGHYVLNHGAKLTIWVITFTAATTAFTPRFPFSFRHRL